MERIHFLGPVQGADKECLLENSKILVLPSYSENFGNVILEAMAQRCPVVVTPEVGLAELVREVGAGQVVEGEPKQLADGIQRLLQNPILRQQMGEAGQKIARERFTWDGVAAQMEQLYGQLIKSSRTADSLISAG
ncbi:MAG: glycosyltransferase family 4 protein [Candidatus Competibacteraceae bacterium]